MKKIQGVKLLLVGMVCLIGIFYVVNGIYFARGLSNCARHYDEAMNSQHCTFTNLFKLDTGHTPLYDTQSHLISYVSGKSWTGIVLVHNSLFLLSLIGGIVLLGRKIADTETGLLAAVVICLYPFVVSAYTSYCPDFALMGIMALCMYLTIRSRFFLDSRLSLLCGFVLLYGVMIRELFAAYMAVPLLIAGVLGIRDAIVNKDYRRMRSVAVSISLIVFVLYILYGWGGMSCIFWNRILRETPSACGFPEKSIAQIVQLLWQCQVSIPFFILFMVGAIVFSRKALVLHRWTLWLWIIIPIFFLTVMPHHYRNRYFLAILPAIALISAYGLRPLLDKNLLRWFTVPVIVILGSLQIFALESGSWGINNLRIGAKKYWDFIDCPLSWDARNDFCIERESLARALVKKSGDIGFKTGRISFAVFPIDWSLEARFIHSFSIMNSSLRFDEFPKSEMIYSLDKTGTMTVPSDLVFLVFMVPADKNMDINSPEIAESFLQSYRSYCRTGYDQEASEVANELPHAVQNLTQLFEPSGNIRMNDRTVAWIFQREKDTVTYDSIILIIAKGIH